MSFLLTISELLKPGGRLVGINPDFTKMTYETVIPLVKLNVVSLEREGPFQEGDKIVLNDPDPEHGVPVFYLEPSTYE